MFCRHNKVKLIRAHANSPTAHEFGHMSAWTDRHNVLNLIKCAKCGKYIKCVSKEGIFEEQGNYKTKLFL